MNTRHYKSLELVEIITDSQICEAITALKMKMDSYAKLRKNIHIRYSISYEFAIFSEELVRLECMLEELAIRSAKWELK